MIVVGRRARRWLFFVSLAACGIDARGQLDAISASEGSDGGASSGGSSSGSSGASSSGSSGDDGGGQGDADVDGGDPGDGSTSRGRVTNGLIALYEFEENGGAVAKDTSGVAPALDLTIPAAVTWMPKAIKFDVAAHVKTPGAPTKIVQRCASNAITVEAWIRYGTLPAFCRIVALSQTADIGNVAMTSDSTTIGFDLRTSTDAYLRSTRVVYDAGTPTSLVHIVETRGPGGVKRIYLNGALVLDVTQDGGFSAAWDPSFPLSIGNTPNLDRPFYGEVHLVAFYDRALSAAEVKTNHTAGADP